MNSRHPGLNALLTKLHRGESLSGEELGELQRHVDELRTSAAERAGGFEPVAARVPGNTVAGYASAAGCARFAARHGMEYTDFYRTAQRLLISSIGIGTYRGAMDNDTDVAYAESVHAALRAGVNLIDTALTYRDQRSELSVAVAIRSFLDESGGSRDEIVVCSKGGYLVPGAVPARTLDSVDTVGARHCIASAFLLDQIDRSRDNLGLETIDVYYLHNPETQLAYVDSVEFERRIRGAFEVLEGAVAGGSIRCYGAATWDGFRNGMLSVRSLARIAGEIAGQDHHFRFIQLPVNYGMREALAPPAQGAPSVVTLAGELGITVIASASLLQGRLARSLPGDGPTGPHTDAQRAIEFARSAPGITAALVGMRSSAHVAENLAGYLRPRSDGGRACE